MRKSNGGVIWLLICGAALGFSLSLVLSQILKLSYLIPIFILLVLSGYITAHVIGRAGGEFSELTKNYSIVLEGFMFGIVFDLIRFRYDWVINVFKYIAVGTFFILVSFVFKRNLEKYIQNNPNDGPHLGLMRPSLLWIFVGFCLAISLNTVTQAFLGSGYFFASLPALILMSLLAMILSNADYDLLDSRSGVWYQLFTGGALGISYDMLLFRVLLWQDLLKLFVVSVVFVVTAIVIRMKKPVKMGVGEIDFELAEKKPKKKSNVVGEISLKPSQKVRTKPTTKKKRSY